MKLAINYSDDKYKKAQNYNTKTAYTRGGFDQVCEYGPDDIDMNFKLQNQYAFDNGRGAGYWIWKPYIIKDALEQVKENDYIFYSDSGSYYIGSVDPLIAQLEQSQRSVMSFILPFMEVQFTKRDIFEEFSMWKEEEKTRSQRLATFILIKKTEAGVRFADEYLSLSAKGKLITDDESQTQPEDSRFIENRHDQSIFSILCKKHDLPAFREPTEYGFQPLLYRRLWQFYNDDKELYQLCINNMKSELAESNYPQILVSYRRKSCSLLVKTESFIKRNCAPKVYWMIRGSLKR